MKLDSISHAEPLNKDIRSVKIVPDAKVSFWPMGLVFLPCHPSPRFSRFSFPKSSCLSPNPQHFENLCEMILIRRVSVTDIRFLWKKKKGPVRVVKTNGALTVVSIVHTCYRPWEHLNFDFEIDPGQKKPCLQLGCHSHSRTESLTLLR